MIKLTARVEEVEDRYLLELDSLLSRLSVRSLKAKMHWYEIRICMEMMLDSH